MRPAAVVQLHAHNCPCPCSASKNPAYYLRAPSVTSEKIQVNSFVFFTIYCIRYITFDNQRLFLESITILCLPPSCSVFSLYHSSLWLLLTSIKAEAAMKARKHYTPTHRPIPSRHRNFTSAPVEPMRDTAFELASSSIRFGKATLSLSISL